MSFRFVEPRTRVGDGIDNFPGATLEFFDFGTTTPKVTYSDFALTVPNTLIITADPNGLFGDIFLDIQADVTLKTSLGEVVYGPISIYAPEDGITDLAAADVSVADVAGNFDESNVETVLEEISDEFLRLDRVNTISAIQTLTAALQMSDQEVRRALLLDYAIVHNDVSSVSNVLTLDLSTGNSFVCTLTENITSIVISNPPATGIYGQIAIVFIQDASGGAYTVDWPVAVLWPGGTEPVITTSNGAVDEFTLRTFDAGTEWRASFSQAFS